VNLSDESDENLDDYLNGIRTKVLDEFKINRAKWEDIL